MDDKVEGSSWFRRASFSRTVYYRSSSMRIDPAQSVPSHPPMQHNPLTNKQRCLSPLPQTKVSEPFKEAQAEYVRKRSLTPHIQRKESERENVGKQLVDHGRRKLTAVGTADEHLVDLSKVQFGAWFSRGTCSDLYHGTYKKEDVAIKIITLPKHENKMLKARLEKQYNREVSLLSRLHHPNVIKFVGACRNSTYLYILTEYLSNGSLRSYLHKQEHKPFPLKKIVAMALDIARGMEYIHSQRVIHRDLKPENILINEAFQLKIADFGIGCYEANCDKFTDAPGTYRWMAPEIIKKKSYGRKVDVYSFGLILWEMVSGNIPYQNLNPFQAAYAAVNKNMKPPFPESCPLVMRAIIEQCWSSEPEKRPEFWQLVQILTQCESSVAADGTLSQVQHAMFRDHNKGCLHWFHNICHHT